MYETSDALNSVQIPCHHVFDVKQTANFIVTYCVNCGLIKETAVINNEAIKRQNFGR